MPPTIEAPPSTGSALPPSTGEIHVTAPPLPKEATPAPAPPTTANEPAPAPPAPPASNPSRDRFESELEKLATPSTLVPPAPQDAPKAPAPTETPPEAPKPATEPPATPEAPSGEPKTGEPKPAEPAAEPKSKNPWKLYKEAKARAEELERKLAETEGSKQTDEEREALQKRADAAEARRAELEKQIAYIDYEKSAEFQSKYQQPYEAAWKRAIAELTEIPIADPATGEQRVAKPEDLVALIQLPLGKARAAAKEQFGDFADDVMVYRKEIRSLLDTRDAALKEARESSVVHLKAQAEAASKAQQELAASVTREWEAAQTEVLGDDEHGPWLAPAEDDAATAELIDKGMSFVDDAMARNAWDPSLKPQERAAVVRKAAAVRARAAAYPRLVHDLTATRAKVAALEAELTAIKGTTPPAGGSTPPASTSPANPWDRINAALESIAH